VSRDQVWQAQAFGPSETVLRYPLYGAKIDLGARMHPSSQAMLLGIIDYAGLFPPARLPMGVALARFVEHSSGSDGWMLGRFVCPASRFSELEPLLAELDATHLPIPIAVLGSGGDTVDEFLDAVTREAASVRSISSRHDQRLTADVFEVRLPASGGVAVAVESAWRLLNEDPSSPITPYFEVSLLGEWRPRLPASVAAVRDTDRLAGATGRVGLKIRCGGLEAAAVPEPEAVAAAIATCRATGVRLKATQGLHHPFRRYDPELATTVHGFINLFAASALAVVHDLPVTRLTEIVAEEDPSAFVIDRETFGWGGLETSANQITFSRENLLTTFGSCSFREPCDDLRELDLI
jgi:hypothetical protein